MRKSICASRIAPVILHRRGATDELDTYRFNYLVISLDVLVLACYCKDLTRLEFHDLSETRFGLLFRSWTFREMEKWRNGFKRSGQMHIYSKTNCTMKPSRFSQSPGNAFLYAGESSPAIKIIQSWWIPPSQECLIKTQNLQG